MTGRREGAMAFAGPDAAWIKELTYRSGDQLYLESVCVVLYCIVLYCIALYCIALHCIVLHCIADGGRGILHTVPWVLFR
jgi:hypothetical protein